MNFCQHCGKELNEHTNFCPHCGKTLAVQTNFCPHCGGNINKSDAVASSATTSLNIGNLLNFANNGNYFIILMLSCLVSVGLTFMKWFSFSVSIPWVVDFEMSLSVFDVIFKYKDFTELTATLAEEDVRVGFIYPILFLMLLIPALNIISVYKLGKSSNDKHELIKACKFTKTAGTYSAIFAGIFFIIIFNANSYVSSESLGTVKISLETAPWLLIGCSIISITVSNKVFSANYANLPKSIPPKNSSNTKASLFGATGDTSSTWRCKVCDKSNPRSSRICRDCGQDK